MNVEALREAIYRISQRHEWANYVDTEDRTEEIAAEYQLLMANSLPSAELGDPIGQAMHDASRAGGPWTPCRGNYRGPDCEHQSMGRHVAELMAVGNLAPDRKPRTPESRKLLAERDFHEPSCPRWSAVSDSDAPCDCRLPGFLWAVEQAATESAIREVAATELREYGDSMLTGNDAADIIEALPEQRQA